MRKYFLQAIILILIISCGKKRVITSQGNMILNEKQVHWEIFEEHDTCFKVITASSAIVAILSAPTESHLKDSSFSETDYFANGNILQVKSYLHGKPDGEWTIYYPNKKKKSLSKTKNGVLYEYRAWYENGQTQVNGSRTDAGRMKRREFFKNGKTSQEFDTDSLGNGTCISFFANGKKESEGNLFRFSPVGIWKRYDSLGKAMSDSLYGFDEKIGGK